MSLITIISIILIVLATTDFMFSNMPRLQNDIYKISFFLTFFLFTIKYYYGPDIDTYVPHYEKIKSLSFALKYYPYLKFEAGYNIFCGLMKSLGCSFWAMTAVVSTIYFTAIYSLFKQLEGKRIFALMILVVMDNGIMYAAIRQCLAVAMFIFMILSIQKNRHAATIITAILAISFHKSALFAVVPTIILYGSQQTPYKKYTFEVLLGMLCLFAIIPLLDVIIPIVRYLPLSWDTEKSIEHHLLLGRSVQVVFLVYFTAMLCVNYFSTRNYDKYDILKVSVIVGFILIAFMYQYFYVLNRMRSYFLPVIIVYAINLTYQYYRNSNYRIPYATLVRQLSVIFLFVYVTFQTYTLEKSYRKTESQIHDCTTIFELTRYNKESIQKRQLKKAELYWEEDFMEGTKNRLDKRND